jgi:medium-chain acyl-[acyl-carrier-protein] hydrolase
VPQDPIWLRPLSCANEGPILFAFPPAGAGPNVFRPWLSWLPPHIELVAVKAPGREDRIGEAPFETATPLVRPIADAISNFATRPFAIFGHSMGGLLGRAVAAHLLATGTADPTRDPPLRLLVVAGIPAPHRPIRDLSLASDGELLKILTEIGGTPAAVLTDPDMYSAYLPCLRADFSVAQSCRRTASPSEAIDVPILALAGTTDRMAPPAECAHWSIWTRRSFTIRVFRGGHFFPITAAHEILPLVTTHLMRAVQCTGASIEERNG